MAIDANAAAKPTPADAAVVRFDMAVPLRLWIRKARSRHYFVTKLYAAGMPFRRLSDVSAAHTAVGAIAVTCVSRSRLF